MIDMPYTTKRRENYIFSGFDNLKDAPPLKKILFLFFLSKKYFKIC